MPAEVEGARRRAYRSPGRDAAALATRRRIIAAASDLFIANGYAGTPVRAVSTAAGVAEKTIYLQFATKAAILKAVVETAIVGDDEAVPVAERDWFQTVITEGDLKRKLEKLADGTCALHERTGAVFSVARGAAAVDPEVAALWAQGKRGHLADMTRMAESFAAAQLVPAGATLDWAIQYLYILLGPESWQLARRELGLDSGGYRDWLLTSLENAFQSTPSPRAREHTALTTDPPLGSF